MLITCWLIPTFRSWLGTAWLASRRLRSPCLKRQLAVARLLTVKLRMLRLSSMTANAEDAIILDQVLGIGRRTNQQREHADDADLSNGVETAAHGCATLIGQSSLGKRSAIGSSVKSATQPTGLLKKRRAQKRGCSPMSNQCRVPAGTWMRSPRSQSTTRTSAFK